MNDEAGFQAHLDAHPGDHTARLVFADWLQERGDHRAEGYRAMGRLRKWPQKDEGGWRFFNQQHYPDGSRPHTIPQDWFWHACWLRILWLSRAERSELEDMFAEGWADVAAEARTELLAQGAVA